MVPEETYRTLDLSLTRRSLYRLSYRGLKFMEIHFGCVCTRAAGMKPNRVLSLHGHASAYSAADQHIPLNRSRNRA